MFASCLNSQLKTYVSWHPEPKSWAVDAFSLNWNTLKFYAFPPFSLLGQTLSKIHQDQAEGILIAPLWTTQPWFPLLMKLVMADPLIILPHKRNLLLPPNFQETHPLFKHLKEGHSKIQLTSSNCCPHPRFLETGNQGTVQFFIWEMGTILYLREN